MKYKCFGEFVMTMITCVLFGSRVLRIELGE